MFCNRNCQILPLRPSAQPSNHHQPLSYYTQYPSCKGPRRGAVKPNLLYLFFVLSVSLAGCPSVYLSVGSPAHPYTVRGRLSSS